MDEVAIGHEIQPELTRLRQELDEAKTSLEANHIAWQIVTDDLNTSDERWKWMLKQQHVSIEPYRLRKGKILCVLIWHDMEFQQHKITSTHGLIAAIDEARDGE